MKKIALALVSSLVLSIVAACSVGAANVNNFHIEDFDIQYTLSRDADNRSTLTTEETITAVFPNRDQNRGIERYIPQNYNGHSTSLEIASVVDQEGNARQYSTYNSGEYLVVRVGNPNRYVQGEQVYTITYTQRDVTRYYSDTGRDEFYWDTNGTEWRVPIQQLSISLTIDESIASAMTGDNQCYQGAFRSSGRCELVQQENTYTASATSLGRGENITLAMGFEADTFAGYQPSLTERLVGVWIIAQAVLTPLAIILLISISVRYSSWRRRKKELGTIIPEYLAPRDASVSLSATILPTVSSQYSFTAQLVDFAVRHYIKMYETDKKILWIKQKVYEFEIIRSTDDLREEEKEFLRDVFKGSIGVGSKTDTEKLSKDQSLWTRLSDNPKKIRQLMRNNYGLKEKVPEKSAWFQKAGTVTIISSLLLLSPALLVVAIIAYALGKSLTIYTDSGLALYRYLEGLKLYISVAEKERLQMLQSPEGAQKVQIDTNDPKQLVKLYEKLLPYAILFGQEKKWNQQLGKLYESAHTQPDWFIGAHAFNAAAFSSAMSSLNTTVSSTGASSSSSGGSGGGGFSGGGGGGGGGGGW